MTAPRTDRYGRYWMADPVTGEEKAFTRATTWAKTLSDQWGLNDWRNRMVAKGIATRDDLRALAAALPLEQKKQLNEVAQQAIEHAGGSSGRNLGTALHEFTAQVDRGEAPDIPAPWDRDIDAYRDTLALHSIRTTGYVEQIVCVPAFGVAGTFDRIVVWDPHAYIADVKTAADLSYAWGEIAVQLALYANAEYLWMEDHEQWTEMPPVDKTQGLVIHLPAGKAECTLWWVDLELGWMAATLAADVRQWRKRKDIARPFGVDLLGRLPVQPVLDLDDSPAAAAAPEPDAPEAVTPTGLDPAHETEGAGDHANERSPVPAGEHSPDCDITRGIGGNAFPTLCTCPAGAPKPDLPDPMQVSP